MIKFDIDRYLHSLEEDSFLSEPYSYMYSLEEKTQEDLFKKSKWVFIRLYNTVYPEKDKSFGAISRKLTMLFSEKALDGKFYTHANINYRLTDQFFGLNFEGINQKEAVYIESIVNEKKSDKTYLIDKSTYSLYGIKITPLEYKHLKLQLEKLKDGTLFKYDLLSFITMGILIFKNKTKNLFVKHMKQNMNQIEFPELNRIKKGLVCSTFVAYVLKNISKEINQWMYDTKKSVYDFAPNSLVKIPGMKFLFDGNFLTYNDDMKKFLEKHPEMKEFK